MVTLAHRKWPRSWRGRFRLVVPGCRAQSARDAEFAANLQGAGDDAVHGARGSQRRSADQEGAGHWRSGHHRADGELGRTGRASGALGEVRAAGHARCGHRSRARLRPKFQEYVQHANENIAVIVQAEHIDAVKNIEAIVQVAGVDAVLVGPYDLRRAWADWVKCVIPKWSRPSIT